MFRTADVHSDREPLAQQIRVPRLRLVVVRKVTQEVPGRVQGVIADIRFAAGCLATDGAGGVNEALDCRERRSTSACGHPVLHIWQENRQLLLRDWNSPVFLAVDDRNGWPPVTLTADEPVAQAIFRDAVALAACFKPSEEGVSSLGRGQTRVPGRVDQHSWLYECFLCWMRTTRLDNHCAYRQTHSFDKSHIAFVMS